ncbi:ABC transporter substrate-binding protein [Ancylobacter dichloromethanicus]|uniref:Amino acid ABC transporter n=1 Tax=Ancylobacter dichloromethanicus TaxID=518825 RepID=A0A9W6MZ46_9HYPH|nr:ABC transporter substrate-binding protein [Ancylobacter dichloromethanicus]MBS7554505.1 ABC transporter substrate-binding protein [Ancylobacter dichloromethanicus]GLK71635.1 amino acid ABC transporter [Ancylobacter dichloromethanicus]
MKFTGILLVAASLAIGAGAAHAEIKKVRIGTEGAYPPFNSVDSSGKLVGFDIEIGEALCAKMKVECTFVAQDWDGIIPALLAKKYDVILASMSITDERKEKVAFTIPYYLTPGSFIAPKDTPITEITPAALKGKTIGAQSSTTGSTYLEDKYPDSDIKLYPTQDEANADLAAGRLDAVLADKFVLYEWLEKSTDGKCCKFVGPDLKDVNPQGTGIAVRKDEDELREMLNKAIREIEADGTYAKINARYFPFPIN